MQSPIAQRPGLTYGGGAAAEVLSWAALSGTWSPVAPDEAAGAAPLLDRADSSSGSSDSGSGSAAASYNGGSCADSLSSAGGAARVTRLSGEAGGGGTMDPATYGDEADDGDDMSGTSDACDSGVGSLDCGNSSCCAHGGGGTQPVRDDVRRRSASVNEAKEQAYGKLKEELVRAQRELQLKDEECERLERVRCQIEAEVEELTASLFEEANKMVQEANIKRMHTEKLLSEANNKVEVLEAEVNALKTLVITSTPSSPNAHLHPQLSDSAGGGGSGLLGAGGSISIKTKLSRSESSRLRLTDLTSPDADKKEDKKGSTFRKMHRRSTSHTVKLESPGSPVKELAAAQAAAATAAMPHKEPAEVNPSLFEEFVTWRRQPTLTSADSTFLSRALREDVEPCLGFASRPMSEAIVASVQDNQLCIEPIAEAKRSIQTCSLTDRPTACSHRIRLAEGEPWYYICEHARNRIAAVCDFYTYVRYIKQGLVKSADEDSYWHMTQLRQRMCNARLGLTNAAV